MTDAKSAERRMKAVEHLADVLVQENAALKRLDFLAAVALVPAKNAALSDLGDQSAPPHGPANPLARRLLDLAAENQILLERAIAVQTRIVRIIARAATPPPAATRYNHSGGAYGGRPPAQWAGALALSTRA